MSRALALSAGGGNTSDVSDISDISVDIRRPLPSRVDEARAMRLLGAAIQTKARRRFSRIFGGGAGGPVFSAYVGIKLRMLRKP